MRPLLYCLRTNFSTVLAVFGLRYAQFFLSSPKVKVPAHSHRRYGLAHMLASASSFTIFYPWCIERETENDEFGSNLRLIETADSKHCCR